MVGDGLPFLKIVKKFPDFRENNLIVSIYELKISFEMQF